MGSAFDAMIARGNAFLTTDKSSETVTYSRPSTGLSRPVPAVIQRGDFSRETDFQAGSDARRDRGIAFINVVDLAVFGGAVQDRDEIKTESGETWFVKSEDSRDAGLVGLVIEKNTRPTF